MNLSGARRRSSCRAGVRVPFAVVTSVFIFMTLGCGNDSAEESTSTTSAVRGEKGPLTHDQAYAHAVQAVQGDPAAPEGISREVFEGLARNGCNFLKAGGSVDELLQGLRREPTRSGRSLRPESGEAVVSAGVRGYCPEYASQLP